MDKFIMALSVYDVPLIGGALKAIVNGFWKGVYGIYFAFIKAIAWVLDMLTQLFFIFAGMTPVSSTTPSASDGSYENIDIVNFFLTQDTFQKAYLYLCLIALGLIVVFAIFKIVKQDYFDREGPRSKGPIFRNIALSFIAFICIIPVFYFLIDAVAALALLVMRAMGYRGGGIGSLIFNISWDDGGDSIATVARLIGVEGGQVTVDMDSNFTVFLTEDMNPSKVYDRDNFGWYSSDTFYAYYWNSSTMQGNANIETFHWYIFIFTGLILIVNLGQMMLAMVTRMYNLIALFIVAPSPISQIVLDDGAKFKGWKDKVIQEALKVVGCVMSFMLFIMIVGLVNELDLMRFAFTSESASAISLLESNNLTTELSNEVSALYYYGDEPSWIDKAINALGRCMIIIAGVGAIKDIDQTITPFISGGSSSMDMGQAGQAIVKAGAAVGKGALAIGRTAISGATQLAGAAVSLGAGSLGSIAGGVDEGLDVAGKVGKGAGEAAEKAGEGVKDAAEKAGEKGKEAAEKANTPNAGEGKEDKKDDKAENATGGDKPEQEKAAGDTESKEAEEVGGSAGSTSDVNGNDEEKAAIDALPTTTGESTIPEGGETDDAAGTAEGEAPEAATDATESGETDGAESGDASKTEVGAEGSKQAADGQNKFNTLHEESKKGEIGKGAKIARKALGVTAGITKGTLHAGLGITGHALKAGGKVAKTAVKTGASIAGILGKTLLSMTGMGKAADALGEFGKGVSSDFADNKAAIKSDVAKHMAKAAPHMRNIGNRAKNTKAGQYIAKKRQNLKDKGGVLGAAANGIANKIDNRSKNRTQVRMMQDLPKNENVRSSASQVANGVANNSNDQFIKDSTNSMAQNVDNQLTNAAELNNINQQITGETNDQLVVNNDQATQIADAYSNIDAIGHDEVSYNAETGEMETTKYGIETMEDMVAKYTATGEYDENGEYTPTEGGQTAYEAHSQDVSDHIASGKQTYVGMTPPTRSKNLHAIHSKMEDLDKKNAGLIKKVNDGDRSAGTMKEYGDYLEERSKLGDAYLYVHSGYAGGKDSYESMAHELEHGTDGKGNPAYTTEGSYDEKAVIDSIEANAQTESEMGVMVASAIPVPGDVARGASTATKLKAASIRTSRVSDEFVQSRSDYDKANKEFEAADVAYQAAASEYDNLKYGDRNVTGYTDEKFAAAEAKYKQTKAARGNAEAKRENAKIRFDTAKTNMATATEGVSKYSTEVRDIAQQTSTNIEETSHRNLDLNKGNERFETAVGEVRVGINKMKASGASQSEIDAAEERLAGLTDMATSSGAKNSYGDSTRRRVKVTGTGKVEKLAKKVNKSAKKNANATGASVERPTNAEAPGKVAYDVDVELNLENEEAVNTAIQGGINQPELSTVAKAYRDYRTDPENNEEAFINTISGIDDVNFSSEQLEAAIANIKKEKDAPKYNYNGLTAREYKKDVKARYKSAVETYNTNMERAKLLAQQYASSNDPVILKAVNEAIEKAVTSSEVIRGLKTELKIDDKK